MEKVVKRLLVVVVVIAIVAGTVVYGDEKVNTSVYKGPQKFYPNKPQPQWWWWKPSTIKLYGTSDGDYRITYIEISRSALGVNKWISWLKAYTNLQKCQVMLIWPQTYIMPVDWEYILWKFDPNNPPLYWDIVSWDSPNNVGQPGINSNVFNTRWWWSQSGLTLHFRDSGIYMITVYIKMRVNGDPWGCWHRGMAGTPFYAETSFHSNAIKIGSSGYEGTVSTVPHVISGNPKSLPTPKLYPNVIPSGYQ